jgi:hypothetical protein
LGILEGEVRREKSELELEDRRQQTEDRQKTGVRSRETGGRRWESEDGIQEAGTKVTRLVTLEESQVRVPPPLIRVAIRRR